MANSKLVEVVGCSQKTLIISRNNLIKLGLISYKKGYKNTCGTYYIKRNTNECISYKVSSGVNSSYSDMVNRQVSSIENTSYIKPLSKGVHILKTKLNKTKEEEKKKNGKEMEKEQKDHLHPHHHLHLKIINLYNKTCKDLPAFDTLSVGLIENLIEKRNKYLKNTEGWTNFFNKVHESDFLNNRIADKQFLANLKWILEKDNFDKIMVGSFDKSFDQKNYRTDFYMSNKERYLKEVEERRKREQLNE